MLIFDSVLSPCYENHKLLPVAQYCLFHLFLHSVTFEPYYITDFDKPLHSLRGWKTEIYTTHSTNTVLLSLFYIWSFSVVSYKAAVSLFLWIFEIFITFSGRDHTPSSCSTTASSSSLTPKGAITHTADQCFIGKCDCRAHHNTGTLCITSLTGAGASIHRWTKHK